jgi:hypothetical protein
MDEKSSCSSTSAAASRATSVPRWPHRDADMRRLECGRIVDAVAGHRHHFPARLQGFDQGQLLLGTHAREHVDGGQVMRQRRCIQTGHVVTGQHLGGVDAGLACNGTARCAGGPR